jgi:hypothetical protein
MATPAYRGAQRCVLTVADHAIMLRLEPCRVRRAVMIIELMSVTEGVLVSRLPAVDVRTALGTTCSRHDETVPPRASSPNSQRR